MAETTIWHGTGDDDDLRLVRHHHAETPQDELLLLRQGAHDQVSMVEPTAVRALGHELIAWADAKQAAIEGGGA